MNTSSLLQEHVDGFSWLQLVLTCTTGIALLLGAVLLFQEDALLRQRGVIVVTAGLFAGSWLLVATPEAFGFTVPTGVGVSVVVFAAVLLVAALSTQKWRR